MAFDLDRFYTEDYDKFSIPPQMDMDKDGLRTAEKLLLALSVIQRMEVKCDDLLEGARSTLAAAYIKEKGAEGVNSAYVFAQRFEKQLNAALDAAMGQQKSR